MPYKDPEVKKEKHAKYSRDHYLKNREIRKQKINARRRELRALWQAWKATLSCSNCGFNHPAALDFHHTDAKNKEGLVSKLLGNGCFKRAKEEAEKCIILCANCHRIHHHEEHKNNVALQQNV